MNFKDNLLEDEVTLLGHSELTDRLLFRIAWNRKMATRFHKYLKEMGWSAGRAPTAEEMPAIREWVEQHFASPEHVESEKRRAECQERGGHAWGPVQLDAREPLVRCPHCQSSMPAHQLPLERP